MIMVKTKSGKIDITKYETTVKTVVNKLLSCRRISQYSIEKDDLYQIGWMAVMNCEKTFDKNRGVKFETYATTAIINAVNKEFKRLSNKKLFLTTFDLEAKVDLRLPGKIMHQLIDVIENSGEFNKIERKILWFKFTDELCFTKIGEQMGVSRETVRKIYRNSINKLKELITNEL